MEFSNKQHSPGFYHGWDIDLGKKEKKNYSKL
jgi:hypothetical protein